MYKLVSTRLNSGTSVNYKRKGKRKLYESTGIFAVLFTILPGGHESLPYQKQTLNQ